MTKLQKYLQKEIGDLTKEANELVKIIDAKVPNYFFLPTGIEKAISSYQWRYNRPESIILSLRNTIEKKELLLQYAGILVKIADKQQELIKSLCSK